MVGSWLIHQGPIHTTLANSNLNVVTSLKMEFNYGVPSVLIPFLESMFEGLEVLHDDPVDTSLVLSSTIIDCSE